ncbi:MAG: archaemetzincin family Zn-dependent metalloprotease [Thermoplasmata archaeon]
MKILRGEGVSPDVIEAISEEIRRIYSGILDEVKTDDVFEVTAKAYDGGRDQYRADIVLGEVLSECGSGESKVLAVVDADLYSEGLNFVFGQAQKPGKIALISLHRLRPNFWGGRKDEDLFLRRAVKEAVHELGHTFGLDHCDNRACVMTFSNRIAHTDRKKPSFCESCREKLKDLSI